MAVVFKYLLSALCTHRILLTTVLTAAAFAFSPSHASDDGESKTQLPTLTIEGDSLAPVGDVEHTEFAGRFTRIDAQNSARDDAQLADVLSFETGVQQNQIGGYGSFSSVSIRAATAAQTGVFLDGIRLNGAANAIVDLSTFDLHTFSAVDIYRGAAPLQLAASNLGGAVNLVTQAQGPDKTTVKLSAGSFQTLQTHLTHRSNHNRWQNVSSIQAGNSENNYSFININGSPLNPLDDALEQRNNAQVQSLRLLSKLGYQHGNRRDTNILLQHSQRTLGVPEWRNASANRASYSDSRGQLHINHRLNSDSRWHQKHAAFIQWADDHYDDRFSQVGLGAQNFRSQQRVLGASTYWERFTEHGKWALTAELRQDAYASEDPLGRQLSVDATRRSLNTGVAYTRFSSNDRWLFTPRLRMEQHRSVWAQTNAFDNVNDNTTVVNPEISVRFNQSQQLNWASSIGQYYRVPTFSEIFGNRGLMVSNPTLRAEKGVNAEVGLEWKVKNNLNLNTTAFISERDNLIAPIFDAQGIGRHINIGKARVTGLESEVSWRPSKPWNIRLNVTLQDALNLSDVAFFNGKQLPGQAAITTYLRASRQVKRNWQLWGEVSTAKDRFYDRGNLLRATDASIFSAGIQWRRADWQAQLTANNISDQNIEDFNGFPRPGRAIYLGLSKRF